MYISSWILYIKATINVVKTMTKAASLDREEQSMHGPCDKIFRYPHRQLSALLYKAPTGEGQAKEAATYLCRTLLRNLEGGKKCNEASFTTFYVCIPSI